MTSSSLADRERAELADLLEKLGPAARAWCGGWTAAHLAAHVATRDRRVDAMAGYGLEQVSPALGNWAHKVEDRLRESTDYAEVVRRVRDGAPRWSPMGWPGAGPLFNTTEFVIHHEDVRR